MLRAVAKNPKPAPVQVQLPGATGIWLREYTRKLNDARDQRKRERHAREAEARERRLEEKRAATRAKAEMRLAKREATSAAKAAEKSEAIVKTEKLDRSNRDPAYWTPERKKQLRKEREARASGFCNS